MLSYFISNLIKTTKKHARSTQRLYRYISKRWFSATREWAESSKAVEVNWQNRPYHYCVTKCCPNNLSINFVSTKLLLRAKEPSRSIYPEILNIDMWCWATQIENSTSYHVHRQTYLENFSYDVTNCQIMVTIFCRSVSKILAACRLKKTLFWQNG